MKKYDKDTGDINVTPLAVLIVGWMIIAGLGVLTVLILRWLF